MDDSGSHWASLGTRCEMAESGQGQGGRADVRNRRENQPEPEADWMSDIRNQVKRDMGRDTSFDRKETGRQGWGEKGRKFHRNICVHLSGRLPVQQSNPECAPAAPGGLLKIDRWAHPRASDFRGRGGAKDPSPTSSQMLLPVWGPQLENRL